MEVILLEGLLIRNLLLVIMGLVIGVGGGGKVR